MIKNQDMSLKENCFVVAKLMFAMAKVISSWRTEKQGKRVQYAYEYREVFAL